MLQMFLSLISRILLAVSNFNLFTRRPQRDCDCTLHAYTSTKPVVLPGVAFRPGLRLRLDLRLGLLLMLGLRLGLELEQ